jgi:hypothetical protein
MALALHLKQLLKKHLRYATVLIASVAYPLFAQAQISTPKSACPAPKELTQQQAYGDWRVTWQDGGASEVLRFGHNPEVPDSLSGELKRGREKLQLAGDLEDGQLTLEESPDGKAISAAWEGKVVEGSCGKAIEGAWTRDESVAEKNAATGGESGVRKFVLRRVLGW